MASLNEALVLGPGAGLGTARDGRMMFKARAEQTDDAFAMVEMALPPDILGPPLHVHHGCDETFYVLEGTLTLRLGERTVAASAGAFALVPRGVPHTFANRGPGVARFLSTISPGRYIAYVEEINTLLATTPAGTRPDMARAAEIGRRHATEFLGPPLGR